MNTKKKSFIKIFTLLYLLFSVGSVYAASPFPVTKAAKAQHLSAVAYDGENFLVVWEDRRNDEKPYVNSDIYAARITENGLVLDKDGIEIAASGEDELQPAVSFDGENYLIVWLSDRNKILGRRISPDGVFIDLEPVTISAGPARKGQPAVAFNGTEYLIVWTDYRNRKYEHNKADIYGRRFAKKGITFENQEAPIFVSDMDDTDPNLIWDGKNYFIVWLRTTFKDKLFKEIMAARVDSLGIAIDGNGKFIDKVEYGVTPRMTFSKNDILIVWEKMHEKNGFDITGTRLSKNMNLLDSASIKISDYTKDQTYPYAVYNGTGYVVAWSDYRNNGGKGDSSDIYATTVTSTGKVEDSSGVPIIRSAKLKTAPMIAYGKKLLILWTDFSNDNGNFENSDIYGYVLSDIYELK